MVLNELQVVVPVGFLLAQPQDVTVCVDRPGDAPLPIRLRLVPARVREQVADAVAVSTPAPIPWSARSKRADRDIDGGYIELGGNG